MTESNRIEFKRELTRELDIEKEVVAFLNYREGGIIYIGVDDSGKPVGVKDIDGDMLKIKDRIRMGILPSPMGLFDVTIERIEEKPVIKVFISSGSEKPYYKKQYGLSPKGCFIRIGTAAEPMTQAQIDDLYTHRVHNSLKNVVSPRQDLTFTQLRIYYAEKGMQLNDNFLRSLDLLTDDGKLNYVAYLLADENGNSMKLAKYAGQDRYELISNNEYGYCCLLTATQKVLDKLDVENKVSSVITPTRRIDTPQWDRLAIREAVINAIVHNDYIYGAPSKIELFSDHLEITSIGRIPQGLSREDFFRGVSLPRNRELMRVFRDVELVESLGSGMQRIMRKYTKDNFEFGDNYIRMVVPYNWVDVQEKVTGKATGKVTGKVTGKATGKVTGKVTGKATGKVTGKATEKTSDKILRLITANPSITIARMMVALSMSDSGIRKVLRNLQAQGAIRRVGSDKTGHWEIIEK